MSLPLHLAILPAYLASYLLQPPPLSVFKGPGIAFDYCTHARLCMRDTGGSPRLVLA